MQIGTLLLKLAIHEARSLKDKRRVVKSLKERLRRKFNVSIAEIEAQDVRQSAVLGVAIVGNERRYLDQVLSQIVNAVRTFRPGLLIDYEIDFLA
tara:strand:- start:134 stop:418 length:285 start_codon:yes stop_codon:yes gene_type:complete